MSRRLGLLAVSRDLWVSLISYGLPEDMVAKRLRLPENFKVVGISYHHFFDRDAVAVKIECPDFVEVVEGGIIPEVYAEYNAQGFVRMVSWESMFNKLAGKLLSEDGKPVGLALSEDSVGGNLVVPDCLCPMDVIMARGCQCKGK